MKHIMLGQIILILCCITYLAFWFMETIYHNRAFANYRMACFRTLHDECLIRWRNGSG